MKRPLDASLIILQKACGSRSSEGSRKIVSNVPGCSFGACDDRCANLSFDSSTAPESMVSSRTICPPAFTAAVVPSRRTCSCSEACGQSRHELEKARHQLARVSGWPHRPRGVRRRSSNRFCASVTGDGTTARVRRQRSIRHTILHQTGAIGVLRVW
eukprot:scaffold744_cov240-Pinguiococcus_pyrenoidosus.AAC.13